MRNLFFRKPFKYTFFNATMYVIIANAVVFFLTRTFPVLSVYLGLSFPGIRYLHFLWQPLTYLFVHGGYSHIIFNMLALLCFGIQVERAIGSKEFLLFYFICGILDGLISVFVYGAIGYNGLIIGASGAIYAVLFLYAVVFPSSVIYIWGIIPVPAPLLVFLYALLAFFGQFKINNTADLVHLAGFFWAWIYIFVRMGVSPLKVWKNTFGR